METLKITLIIVGGLTIFVGLMAGAMTLGKYSHFTDKDTDRMLKIALIGCIITLIGIWL